MVALLFLAVLVVILTSNIVIQQELVLTTWGFLYKYKKPEDSHFFSTLYNFFKCRINIEYCIRETIK